jgi:hypothetical protein|tara:strand:- start:304 stop:432 length:129 start_codon:yes stop_codon:yes gene_type:complete
MAFGVFSFAIIFLYLAVAKKNPRYEKNPTPIKNCDAIGYATI